MLDLASVKKFENLELLAKELVEGFITGLHRSPYHGFSVEFAEHKLYNYGESTRFIDWKVFAKTDQLYTKQYEEETNLRATILLDASASMYYPVPGKEKITFAVYAAAALSLLLLKQRDAIGLITYDSEIIHQTAQKSSKIHINQVLQYLQSVLTRTPEQNITKTSQNLHLIADRLHKRSLVILFTDMFQQKDSLEDIFEALQHLKHNRHEILLFHISDHQTELSFDFEDRPYRFKDPETNESITLQPHQIKDSYRSEMKKYYNEIKLGCGKLKIDFIEVDTQDTFDKVLGAYLIKRKRMQ